MTRAIGFIIFAVFLAFSGGQVAFGSEIFENFANPRALGMGNAYSSIVDDKDAVFYNPAGLDRIRGFHLTLLDPQVGTDALDAYTTYRSYQSGDYSTLIRQFYGKKVSLQVSDSLFLSMRDFAIGGYDFLNLSINLDNPAYPNLNFNATNDYGLIAGVAMSLAPQDMVRLGFVGKRVTRYGGRVAFGPSLLATLSNTELQNLIANYGTGYGVDSGLLIEIPIPSHPCFSFVWQDMGQTQFTTNSSTYRPPVLDNNITLGFSLMFDAYVVKVRPALDFRHYTVYDEPVGKRLHAGLELEFPGFSLRGGTNQGYLTYGVGLDLKYIRLDAASYGVELQSYPGQLEDRRYVMQVTVDLNFDPTFGDGKSSGAPAKRFLRR